MTAIEKTLRKRLGKPVEVTAKTPYYVSVTGTLKLDKSYKEPFWYVMAGGAAFFTFKTEDVDRFALGTFYLKDK